MSALFGFIGGVLTVLVFKLLEWMAEKRLENTKEKKKKKEMKKSINSSNYTGVCSFDHLDKIIAMSSVLPECLIKPVSDVPALNTTFASCIRSRL